MTSCQRTEWNEILKFNLYQLEIKMKRQTRDKVTFSCCNASSSSLDQFFIHSHHQHHIACMQLHVEREKLSSRTLTHFLSSFNCPSHFKSNFSTFTVLTWVWVDVVTAVATQIYHEMDINVFIVNIIILYMHVK